MSDPTVRIDPASLRDTLNLLAAYRQGSQKALYRSINLGAKKGRKAAVDGMAQKANLTKKRIREKTSVYFTSLSGMSAKVVIKGGSTPLIHFGARQTKKGVTFKLWKDEGRERYRHSFIAKLGTGGTKGVYERDIGSPQYDGRTPLRAKSGPAVPVIYQKTPGLAQKAEETAAEAMLKELDRQVGLINRGLL
ncbi:Prophage minor tail protein Z (GPZ) [Marinobacter sp. LV10R510-11A]|uniref:phage tail protein n=1 Tax=Marinobacter sp. LV10R510-11A TaxID=1415568 RepID=UPI000BB6DD74|nr:phage tail protein [Marinobacter sp. LV10R510-11A]SOB76186.1 Prophage minor tail protein Z (GPZ) [Marinobacter sp. LV10R510-11A]